MPKTCSCCGVSKGKPKFTNGQWKDAAGGVCRECAARTKQAPHAVDGGGAPAHASGGSAAASKMHLPPVAHAVGCEEELEFPCPICLDNEDDACVGTQECGQCSACGQIYCGACKAGGLADRSPNCPTCRAPLVVSDNEHFKRFWKLVHDRSPGRHTSVAQVNLGASYYKGVGVKQDHKEAVMWYRLAAEQGCAVAQHNLGNMCRDGRGVKQDHTEAVRWYRLAAEQGNAVAQCNLGGMYASGIGVPQDFAAALKWGQLAAEQGDELVLNNLDGMQQHNLIPTPPPGTAVTTILLTSAAGSKYNNKPGTVVLPNYFDGAAAIKPGRVAVLLEGAAVPISFKLMNLRV